jgi:hypothetical protein
MCGKSATEEFYNLSPKNEFQVAALAKEDMDLFSLAHKPPAS